MRERKDRPSGRKRLRASPNFAQMLSFDGRPFIAKDSEPYEQFWLSERERMLLSLFSGKRGNTPDGAARAYFRLSERPETIAERARVNRAIAEMREAGILVAVEDDASRYTHAIAKAYLTHRPFPPEIVQSIIEKAPLRTGTRVLDIAGGPGDLAVQLAAATEAVSLLELSRGFLDAAALRAEQAGRRLNLIHDSANRLMFRDDRFDVLTVSQALHWLDDIAVCRGVCRLMAEGGSFFVIHVAFDVPEAHPLAYLFGARSILGAKETRPFVDEVGALCRRLCLLFEALDTPDVDRVDLARGAPKSGQPISLDSATIYRQNRLMGLGFARGFLTDDHIAVTGLSPDAFWRDAEARCAEISREKLSGRFDWALLHFRRAARTGRGAELLISDPVDIGFNGSPEG